mmetsp:Transcript_12026/g.15019  ORF Transcript_12026/g.15019 Transcript_12026/m.15019 type:complete len:93 (-) Transcript_12026:563-841(-)
MLGGSLYVLVYYLSGFWDGLFIRIMSKPEATGVNPNVNTIPGSDYQVHHDLTGNQGLEVKEASGAEFCDKQGDGNTFVKKNLETRPLTQTGQ